jgi:hypothetical protein
MALALVFREPLPMQLLKRTLAEAELQAFAAGLGSAQPHSTYEFNLNRNDVTPVAKPGALFNAYFEPEGDSAIPEAISEQLQIDHQSIVYRTWSYVSWNFHKNRIKALLEPIVPNVFDVVGLAHARLEYRDRFYFNGPIEDVDNSDLFQSDSRYIVPNAFQTKSEWHSYTGNYIETNGVFKKLLQIAINAVDEQEDGNSKRRVDVLTAIENRYQPDVEISAEAVFTEMDRAHDDLIATMSELITKEMAARIYLKG